MPAQHARCPSRRSDTVVSTTDGAGAVTLQHRLEALGVGAFGGLLRALPVERASALMAPTMAAIMARSSKTRRALAHLQLAMPDRAEEHRDIVERMWRHLGRVTAEAFHIDRLVDDESRLDIPEEYDRLRLLAKDGVIMATPHLGNWEIGAAIARRTGLSVCGVYQKLHNPIVEQRLKAMRAEAYPAGLYSKGPRLGPKLVTLARQGHAIGLVADLREKRGVGVNFFGQPAFATPMPAMLARLSGRPLIAGAVLRTEGVHFRALLQAIDVPVTDERDRDIQQATQALHDTFESWIRQSPEQWMWTHRKWAKSNIRVATPRRTR